MMSYWLVKSDPETYSWHDLVKDKKTSWDGVRNFQARNALKQMKKGDRVFVYESQGPKLIVGIAEVAREAYPDPTAKEGDWVCVDLKTFKALKKPVSLAEIKENRVLKKMPLVTHSRLSVMPVARKEWETILDMSNTGKSYGDS